MVFNKGGAHPPQHQRGRVRDLRNPEDSDRDECVNSAACCTVPMRRSRGSDVIRAATPEQAGQTGVPAGRPGKYAVSGS